MPISKRILPIIVISQFCCTSLWFAGNGVMGDLILNFNLQPTALGQLTSAVQFGFILGTLVFALLSIADRFSPSKVFFSCAILGSLFNATIIWDGNGLYSLLTLRILTGFFLAGIYPVGIKIAADYFDKQLGKSLGFLVGALTLGTAFPHLAKGITAAFPWQSVLLLTSSLAILGGTLMLLFVPNGPFRKPAQQLKFSACIEDFKTYNFRAAAFGYFGHMWELYAFWTFVPILLHTYNNEHSDIISNTNLWSFLIIGIGGLACVLSGYLSRSKGVKKVATFTLMVSSICCLISPVLFQSSSKFLFLGFLILWGMVVIADSPLFSTLVAQSAPPETKGTALTIVNCFGFALTIVSIQLLSLLHKNTDPRFIYLLLAIGPIIGLMALSRKKQRLT